MRLFAVLGLLTVLSACGADGPPIPPEGDETRSQSTSVTVSGDARIGVIGSF